MRAASNSMSRALKAAWWWLRQVSGDAAYEAYLCHVRASEDATERRRVLSRQEFYLEIVRRRYNSPSRCC
jgi:uncharacterized short protein YbdD (DUF466 family)